MIDQTLWYSTALSSHLKSISFNEGNECTKLTRRIDPRTRDDDYQTALSFEIFDPLWMLSRQWQYGRFKAVDCGSPVLVKVKTEKGRFDHIQCRDSAADAVSESYFVEKPLEYEVEKQNVEITPYVRVESAMQLKKMLIASKFSKESFEFLYKDYKLLDELNGIDESEDINALKKKNNRTLQNFYKFYRNRSFDGVKVYQNFEELMSRDDVTGAFKEVLEKYVEWFKNKFMPCGDNDERDYWSNEKLGYELKIKRGANTYIAEDYDTGKLSWYSFDSSLNEKNASASETNSEVKLLSYIPSPAKIPGAPASRLWEFEDQKVNMGSCGADFSFIGTAAIMQYVSMFSNDWMIVPLETETGTVLDVKGILVKDSFGDRFYIVNNAQKLDAQKADVIYTDRWNLFGTSYDGAYEKRSFSTDDGLLFPPTVLRYEESKPIEEVQFLRDEMSNMVWGVEITLNNRCGGSMDGKLLSDLIFNDIDESNGLNDPLKTESEVNAAYSLLIQNRVPANWIPFIPEKTPDSCRDVTLRRGRMPVYYKGKFRAFEPSSGLIGYKRDKNNHVVPCYVNEEEVSTCGIRIIKSAQRTRWFLGESFNWIGNKQVVREYQANSGLMFDELIGKSTGTAITLGASNSESVEKEGE